MQSKPRIFADHGTYRKTPHRSSAFALAVALSAGCASNLTPMERQIAEMRRQVEVACVADLLDQGHSLMDHAEQMTSHCRQVAQHTVR